MAVRIVRLAPHCSRLIHLCLCVCLRQIRREKKEKNSEVFVSGKTRNKVGGKQKRKLRVSGEDREGGRGEERLRRDRGGGREGERERGREGEREGGRGRKREGEGRKGRENGVVSKSVL